ncbi:hypothetical protein I4U23_006755 [Adineta vaga]|nr:hypothetical protein I4U23_006755 [Adineta vaga]
MSSTRTAPRTTITNKSTHHTNGSSNSYDMNDSTVTSESDSNLQRSVLMKNASQLDGVHRNPRFIHAFTIGLLGQPVIVQTNEQERFHGILETISANGDVSLISSHRLDNNNSDIMTLSTALIDLFETVNSSFQTFELQKRMIQASNIVEIIAIDVDLSGNGKCMLEETPKISQLEDERFNRMQHFYDADETDPSTLEDLDLGEDGKAGYDPEDMFHTNREKFNTTTDYDETKYTNIPIRQMTAEESADIDKKAMEIERGIRTEDIDEDDAGVKRPSEFNVTHNNDDGNSNPKSNQSSRLHPNERRSDFRLDTEYNSKRGNWRDQRGGGNNRRGGPNNYSTNNPKQNQRSEQTQYTTSRSSEQTPNNRQQSYKLRNNRFNDNRSPHEGRDSPLQVNNDETTRGQRIHSGSFSQGQNSGPTSPSTTLPARGVYSANNRSLIGRNSPAPYTGSSSSRNNSTAASSSPPPPGTSSYQTNPTGGSSNYQQQSNNKMIKKQTRNEQQSTNEDNDQPKQQRNQQQNSSNNHQSNTVPLSRPSHLHTQQMKQQPPPPQQQQQQQHLQSSSSSNNVPSPLALPNSDDHSSSHEPINSNQTDPNIHMANPPVYAQQTTAPGNSKANSGLNPEADEFVPVFTRESNSRPESRGASTNTLPMAPFISHPNPQALHLLQQQQQQQQQHQQQQQIPQNQTQQPSMMPQTHAQNAAALYSPYYPAPYTNMSPFVGAAQQQMNAGMMGAPMMPPTAQQLTGNGPNTNNVGPGGMTTPNGSSGPAYKTNNNQTHSGNSGNTNVGPKKAVVSVQGNEQPNISQQQQQVASAQQMVFPAQSLRYYQSEFPSQQTTPSSMQHQFFYPINTPGMIQATGVGPPQNIMISSAPSSAGPTTPVPPIYYQGLYSDPRIYGVYPSAASGGVNTNWQLTRSPPHQQQQQQQNEQQRGYVGGQNVVSQAPPPTGAPNPGGGGSIGRSASTSGPVGPNGVNNGGPAMTPQYALSGNVSTTYAYGPPQAWYPAQAQVSSPQTNMPPQLGAYGMMFDPSQPGLPQQAAYVHPYDPAYFQQAQQAPPQQQQGLDTVPPGSYNR